MAQTLKGTATGSPIILYPADQMPVSVTVDGTPVSYTDNNNGTLTLTVAPTAGLPVVISLVKRQASNGGPVVNGIYSQSGVPMVAPPSGSVGDNGALTLDTALPANMSGAKCFMYFGEGVLYAGSLAGMYYTVMSSTTVGVVYADRYVSGTPVIPAAPTPIVATGPGAYTQPASTEITFVTVTLKGGTVGDSGRVYVESLNDHNNSAATKTHRAKLKSSWFYSNSVTTSLSARLRGLLQNRGVPDKQIGMTSATGGAINETAALSTSTEQRAVDTSVDQDITLSFVTASDSIGYGILQAYSIEVRPA